MTSPDRLALETERDFLLQSLENLESEYSSGGIDEDSYRNLHDDYTARTAIVLRKLSSDGKEIEASPPVSNRRRVLTISAISAFIVIAAISLAFAVGIRLPGQSVTGNTESTSDKKVSSADRQRRLEAAVAADPKDISARLLLAQYLEAQGDLALALEQYDAILTIDTSNAPALAQSGRILYLTAGAGPAVDAAGLVEKSQLRLDAALLADPEYSEARFFRAIVRANEFADFSGAQGDLQRYLVTEPNGRFAAQARQLLTDVTNALSSPSSSGGGG